MQQDEMGPELGCIENPQELRGREGDEGVACAASLPACRY